MKRQVRQQNKGETIVEVVVAFALLLLFMSVLAGAIRFSAAAQQKAAAQADVNYKVAAALRQATPARTGTRDFAFGFAGGTTLFSMKAGTTQTEVDTESSGSYSFYRYQKAE